MSGKPYSMKEMKAIVEYLTEHRAYKEIKGRKMWMDYANSNLTTRTWQSLKETFLKRILPDITNPYYKLTVQQIASFQQGSDIEARLNNKLEIRTADEDSNSNDAQDRQPSNTNDNKNDNAVYESGENKHSRSSTDTVVIEPCYNTAEEIQKELESPVGKGQSKDQPPKASQAKSIRDYITYSEPLTPMLQEVLHDFETDEDDGSDKEPQMQIVEYPEPNIPNDNLLSHEIIDTENESEKNDTKKKENLNNNVDKDTLSDKSDNQKKVNNNIIEIQDNTDTELIEIPDDTPNDSENSTNNLTKKNYDIPDVVNDNAKPNSDVQMQIDTVNQLDFQNNSLPQTGTLPNNQEAFKELCMKSNLNNEQSDLSSTQKNLNDSKKRSKSQEVQSGILKKRLRLEEEIQKSSSDVDGKAQNIKRRKTKSTKKKIIANKEEKKKNDIQNVTSNENHEDLSKNNKNNSSDIDSVCLSDDNNINQQPMNTKPSTSKSEEKEKAPTAITTENPITNESKDISRTSKTAEDANRDRKKCHNLNTDTENDMSNDEHQSTKKEEKSKTKSIRKEGEMDKNQYIREVINEVVILKSQSESASDNMTTPPKKDKAALRAQRKVHRDKALANVFGFASGLNTSRKKTVKHRKRLPSFRINNSSDSDEWTSDTESEYISPPRGRKNRQTRKYLKPKSARILSLEEEGGLFVVYGKKIFPLVKDGKIIKNYTTFTQDDDEDTEESFWKLKYVEEKKKTEELTKLLKENKKLDRDVPATNSKEKSPTPINLPKEPDVVTNNEIVQKQSICKEIEQVNQEVNEPKTVKIKYTKNNEEVQLEGHWSHVHPVLEHLVNILHKDQEPTKETTADNIKPTDNKQITTVDKESAMDIKQSTMENKQSTMEKNQSTTENKSEMENITTEEAKPTKGKTKSNAVKTRGNAKKSKVSIKKSKAEIDEGEKQQGMDAAKKLPDDSKKNSRNSTPMSIILLDDDVNEKINQIEDEIFKEIEEREKADSILENSDITNITQRKGAKTRARKCPAAVDQSSPAKKARVSSDDSKTPEVNKKTLEPEEDNKTMTAEETRLTRTPKKAANNKEVDEKKKGNIEKRVTRKSMQNAQNKYNFRSSPAEKKPANENAKRKTRKIYTALPARIISSPDTISNDSIESSLGYQDSDVSVCVNPRRKRKLSLSVLNKGKAKSQRGSKTKVQSYSTEFSSDSSLSFVTAPVKHSSHQSSSLCTQVYRSESYQMLFPQKQNSFKHLDKIDEVNPPLNDTYFNNNIINNYVTSNLNIKQCPCSTNDEDNSSQITLPPSPVLSIVENISVNKNLLCSSNEMPVDVTINETIRTELNENMCSNVDISAPLIDQNCSLQENNDVEESNIYINVPEPTLKVSDSLVNKISAVKIKEPTLSESTHQKFKNLLLESAKKIDNQMKGSNKTDHSNKMEVCEPDTLRKTKGRKRCSTPRKRPRRLNAKIDNTKQLIEEQTESCASKKSFSTPVLVAMGASDYENMAATDDITASNDSKTETKKKKEVIKVKIAKPKTKKKEKILDDTADKDSKSSLQSDSGINDTESGVFLQGCEETVDLIHNHSDTCLQAHECVDNSVEVVDENAMSIITLNTNSPYMQELKTSKSLTCLNNNGLLDIFCEDAQDAANVFTENKNFLESTDKNESNLNISDANLSINSLITEDLSDEVTSQSPQKQNSKWYLLSEDDTSNTNFVNMASRSPNSNSGCGSNLQQIFPIVCAVPDLSTITEERTPKVNTDFDTQSLPDVNSM